MSKASKKTKKPTKADEFAEAMAELNRNMEASAHSIERLSEVMRAGSLLWQTERRVVAARSYWDAITLAGDEHTPEDCARIKKLCGGASEIQE